MEIKVYNLLSTTPIRLQVLRDNNAVENVSTTVASAAIIHERFWVLNTADTAYDIRPVVSLTTTALYDNTDTTDEVRVFSLRVHAFLRPDGARKLRIVIDTEDQYGTGVPQEDAGLDPKTIRDNLQALERGAPIAVTDPDGNTANLFITSVSDLEQRVGTEPTHYRLVIEAVKWISS